MATHSSPLAWKIPWTEESGRLQSMGSLSRTRLSNFTFAFHFHALEKEMATHSSVLAWRIPGTGEPGGLLSMGSRRVGHDWSDSAAAAATCNWTLAFSSVMNAMTPPVMLSPTQLQLFSCHFTELTDLPQCPFQSLVLRNYVTIRPTGLSCFLLLFIYFFGCAMGHEGS